MSHDHACAGCGKEWPCANRVCTDLRFRSCGCDAPLPLPVTWTMGLEDAGHSLHEAAQAFQRRGDVAQADGCLRARQALLIQVRHLAQRHGLPG